MSRPPLRLLPHEDVCSVIRHTDDYYEGDILRDVHALVPHHGVVVDAGAHIGNHSVYWLEHQDPDWLVAFEPMVEQYTLLRRNLRRYRNAEAIPLALSDEPGPVRFAVDEQNRGRCHITPEGEREVEARTLDSFDLEKVTLLKVDVEGWQAHVLRGAASTLEASHPALLVEDGEQVVESTLADLGLLGYRVLRAYEGANFLWVWVP